MDLDNLKPTNRQSSIVNRQSQSAANQKLEAGSRKLEAGFTLIELMIVVSILGILAAIVYPEFQGHVQQAKEAQAKANLKLLRDAIERYAADHGGPPGYPADNFTGAPVTYPAFYLGLINGGYINTLPRNPFNGLSTFKMIQKEENFPTTATGEYGWIYKGLEKNIRLDWGGTDSEGNPYIEY